MRTTARLLTPLLAALSSWPGWASSGILLRDEALRAAASATAPVTAQVAKGASVEVLSRQGGWTQIRVSGRTGWVRMLSVRTTESVQRDVGGELAGVIGLGSRQADPSRVVSVAGVRGLTEQDLRNAQFSAQEIERLERYAVSPDEARAFARQGGLAAQRLDYLPTPGRGGTRSSPWEETQW